jgi:hypothetical protein
MDGCVRRVKRHFAKLARKTTSRNVKLEYGSVKCQSQHHQLAADRIFPVHAKLYPLMTAGTSAVPVIKCYGVGA